MIWFPCGSTSHDEVDLLWLEETAISLVEQAIHATTNSQRTTSLPDQNNRLERVEADGLVNR